MQLSLCCPPLPLATTKMLPNPLRPAITPCCRAACGEERATGGKGTEPLPSPGSPRHPLRVCAGGHGWHGRPRAAGGAGCPKAHHSAGTGRAAEPCPGISSQQPESTLRNFNKQPCQGLGVTAGATAAPPGCVPPRQQSGSCYGPEPMLGFLSEPNKGRDGANIWAGELLI